MCFSVDSIIVHGNNVLWRHFSHSNVTEDCGKLNVIVYYEKKNRRLSHGMLFWNWNSTCRENVGRSQGYKAFWLAFVFILMPLSSVNIRQQVTEGDGMLLEEWPLYRYGTKSRVVMFVVPMFSCGFDRFSATVSSKRINNPISIEATYVGRSRCLRRAQNMVRQLTETAGSSDIIRRPRRKYGRQEGTVNPDLTSQSLHSLLACARLTI